MVVVVVALGVVALALLIATIVLASRASAAAKRITELEAQAVEAELAASTASDRADKESARAVEAEGRAKAADKRATDAERRATDAEQRTEAAEEKVAEAIDRADQSEERALAASEVAATVETERDAVQAERDTVQAALAAALEIRLFDADGMWALGRRRMDRLWRDRLRLMPDEDSPLDGSDGDPEAAVRLMTEASREESGVVVDLTWSVPEPLSPARAALIVLLAEELIAVARESDGGELAVTASDDGIDVTLRADPMTADATIDELRTAVASFGWTLTADDASVAVRVPTPAADDNPAETAPDAEPGGSTGSDEPRDGEKAGLTAF